MQKRVLATLLILLAILCSCRSYRHIYSPPPPNDPFFREKGSSRASLLYSGADGNNGIGKRLENQGIDLQVAYAILNHWAITGSYFLRNEKDHYDKDIYKELFNSSTVDYKRKLTDFGVGYFTTLDSRKKATFSIYAGYGFGNFRLNDSGLDDTLAAYSRFYEARIHKWYLQPGINFWFGDNLSMGLVGRYSFIRYFDNATSYAQAEQEYFHLNRINKKTLITIEPSLMFEFTIPSLRCLKADAGVTVVASDWRRYPSTRAINGSIGLTFDFSALKGKK